MFIKRFLGVTPKRRANASPVVICPEHTKHTDQPQGNTRFNIVHILDKGAMHGLQGYQELIETTAWGLEQLGENVTITENLLREGRINIIFGAQVLPAQDLLRLPSNTIVYNLEQMGGLDLSGNPVAKAIATRYLIWDYSESNLQSWKKLGPIREPIHVPVGWAPILDRIPKPLLQDIDILIYGKPGPQRLKVFNELCQRGLKCLFVCGLYGRARDELIARSKIVLNINLYEHSRIFEIVRVSYLLANAKAVVADIHKGTSIDADLSDAMAFVRPEQIVDTCTALLQDDATREQLEIRGKQIIERRSIVPILRSALTESRLAP